MPMTVSFCCRSRLRWREVTGAVVGVVAVLGVVGALLISVLQRRRELGLLRAIGATQAQVLRTVRHELAHHLGADELGVRELGL